MQHIARPGTVIWRRSQPFLVFLGVELLIRGLYYDCDIWTLRRKLLVDRCSRVVDGLKLHQRTSTSYLANSTHYPIAADSVVCLYLVIYSSQILSCLWRVQVYCFIHKDTLDFERVATVLLRTIGVHFDIL
jgi:hypothetical protein